MSRRFILQARAELEHGNRLQAGEIVEAVEAVEDALPLLESLDFQPPRPFVIRSNQQLRRLAQLTGNRELQLGDTSSVGFSLRQSEPPSGGGQ